MVMGTEQHLPGATGTTSPLKRTVMIFTLIWFILTFNTGVKDLVTELLLQQMPPQP